MYLAIPILLHPYCFDAHAYMKMMFHADEISVCVVGRGRLMLNSNK